MWHAVLGDANPYVVLGSLALVLVIYAALSYQFNKDPTKFLDFALRYRWIAVLFIVLPASKLMHTYTYVAPPSPPSPPPRTDPGRTHTSRAPPHARDGARTGPRARERAGGAGLGVCVRASPRALVAPARTSAR